MVIGKYQRITALTGKVSIAVPCHKVVPLLLKDTDIIRFVPDLNFDGHAALNFRAWDQSTQIETPALVDVSNHGGRTAFSAEEATASIDVLPVNDAPELSSIPIAPTFQDGQGETYDSSVTVGPDGVAVTVWVEKVDGYYKIMAKK